MNASERCEKSEAETGFKRRSTTPLPPAEVRAALRATLIANAYLEAEIERLTEAVSTGFARGRMRKATQRVNKI